MKMCDNVVFLRLYEQDSGFGPSLGTGPWPFRPAEEWGWTEQQDLVFVVFW